MQVSIETVRPSHVSPSNSLCIPLFVLVTHTESCVCPAVTFRKSITMITTQEPTEPQTLPHATDTLTRHRGLGGTFDKHTKIVDFESSQLTTFVGTMKLYKGKFYYEIEVKVMGSLTQFGWATSNFACASVYSSKGVGNDDHSWGFDGNRVQLWGNNQSVKEVKFGSALKVGDILGLAIDLELKTISFSLNGDFSSPFGVAFVGIKLPRAASVFPAISSHSGVYNFNFGEQPFTGNPPDDSYISVVRGSRNSDGNSFLCNNVFCNDMIDHSVCGHTIFGGLLDFICYETIFARCIVSPLVTPLLWTISICFDGGLKQYEVGSEWFHPGYTFSCLSILECCVYYRKAHDQDSLNRNILHGSAASGSLCALRLLTDCCCVKFYNDFVNAVDDDGNTPLHYAADLSIAYGKPVSLFQSNSGATSRVRKYVSSAGRARLCRFLLRHGTDVHIRNKTGQTALDLCTDPVVRRVLETAVAVESRPSVNGFEYTAKMHFEAEHGEPLCCIEYCRNMNDQYKGNAPICVPILECFFIETLCLKIFCCPLWSLIMMVSSLDGSFGCFSKSHPEPMFATNFARANISFFSTSCPSFWTVLWSLQNGHKHLRYNEGGVTLLMNAALSGNYTILRLFSMVGVKFEEAFINFTDRDGNTALHYCTNTNLGFDTNDTAYATSDGIRSKKSIKRSDKVLVARYLLANGADVQIQNKKGQTALDVCTSSTMRELLFEALLIQTGQIGPQQVHAGMRVKPNFMVGRGVENLNIAIADNENIGVSQRVLLTACLDGQMDVVLACLNGEINVNCKDNKGHSPLLLALIHNHYDIVRVLVAKGAMVINKDIVDKSPLDVCFSAIEKSYFADESTIVATVTELFLLMAVTVPHYAKLGEFLWKIVSFTVLKHTQLDQFYSITSADDTHALWFRMVQSGTEMTDSYEYVFSNVPKPREFLNGMYQGTEEMCNDKKIYRMEKPKAPGTYNWLVYNSNGKWQVTDEPNKRTTNSFCATTESCDDPSDAKGTWQYYDGQDWVTYPEITCTKLGKSFANSSSDRYVTNVANLASAYPRLIEIKDKDGRSVIEVASKPIKEVLRSLILWHGRYQLTETRPEHQSATCRVFKAVDTLVLDERGQPSPVALKLMAVKDQFNRELTARLKGQFDDEFVVTVRTSHPQLITTGGIVSGIDDFPNVVEEDESDEKIRPTKTNAERYFLVVMPLADRNLFVAMKQERWAGRNMEEVKHCFTQLVRCVDHMHRKGLLHADLKTLNVVRIGGKWKLIDLDASCMIGQEAVGHKSSTAYCPPEVIYINQTGQAVVRSPDITDGLTTPLIAHPSFDVFSLGCILYQLCNKDVLPLFQGNQDDNLRAEDMGSDNDLWSLYEWSIDLKTKKLSAIDDPVARNLLSQMLHKDPLLRPTIPRLLAHPFLSSKSVARMIGDQAEYDVFLSYRVASDSQHVEKMYHLLTAQGLKVWWDKLCLLPGVDWKVGFCAGLVNSKAFVCLLSRHAINHPDRDWQNFSKLTVSSRGDNVFL